ncbi:MAG: ExeA family protein [Candidatus Binatia bacterium]
MGVISSTSQTSSSRLDRDSHFFYINSEYEAIFKQLTEGIRQRKELSFLVGPQGTGKTKLMQLLTNSVDDTVSVVSFPTPPPTLDALLTEICQQLFIQHAGETSDSRFEAIVDYLRTWTSRYESIVLVIDDAHLFSPEVLSQLVPLLDLPEPFGALLQVILVGRPELETTLARPELQPLAQHVAVRCQLGPLQPEEVGQFIRQRYQEINQSRPDIFTPEAIERIAHYSQAIPFRITQLCEQALRAAYMQGQRTISLQIIEDLGQQLVPTFEAPLAATRIREQEPGFPASANGTSASTASSYWPDVRSLRRRTIRLGRGLVIMGLCSLLLLSGLIVGKEISDERLSASMVRGLETVTLFVSGIGEKLAEIVSIWRSETQPSSPDQQSTTQLAQ